MGRRRPAASASMAERAYHAGSPPFEFELAKYQAGSTDEEDHTYPRYSSGRYYCYHNLTAICLSLVVSSEATGKHPIAAVADVVPSSIQVAHADVLAIFFTSGRLLWS